MKSDKKANNMKYNKAYGILDNGGIPFMVFIKGKKVSVFMMPTKKYFIKDENERNPWT